VVVGPVGERGLVRGSNVVDGRGRVDSPLC